MEVTIFCLHHPVLIDRKIKLETQFDQLNLRVEWVCNFSPTEISIPAGAQFKNINEYSLYLKQQYCIEQQIKRNLPLILVLEDDVILPNNFVSFANQCLQEFKNIQGDFLSLGTCCNIVAKNITPNKNVYYDTDYRTRCAHCYVTTLHAAKTIYQHLTSNQCAFDFKLNQIIEKEKLKVCYAEPGILQATEEKLIKSSLQL